MRSVSCRPLPAAACHSSLTSVFSTATPTSPGCINSWGTTVKFPRDSLSAPITVQYQRHHSAWRNCSIKQHNTQLKTLIPLSQTDMDAFPWVLPLLLQFLIIFLLSKKQEGDYWKWGHRPDTRERGDSLKNEDNLSGPYAMFRNETDKSPKQQSFIKISSLLTCWLRKISVCKS